jgi:hypothetical protein
LPIDFCSPLLFPVVFLSLFFIWYPDLHHSGYLIASLSLTKSPLRPGEQFLNGHEPEANEEHQQPEPFTERPAENKTGPGLSTWSD